MMCQSFTYLILFRKIDRVYFVCHWKLHVLSDSYGPRVKFSWYGEMGGMLPQCERRHCCFTVSNTKLKKSRHGLPLHVCSFLCAGQVLNLDWYPLSRDSSYYAISLLVIVCFVWDQEVKLYEAILLFLLYMGYIAVMCVFDALLYQQTRPH